MKKSYTVINRLEEFYKALQAGCYLSLDTLYFVVALKLANTPFWVAPMLATGGSEA